MVAFTTCGSSQIIKMQCWELTSDLCLVVYLVKDGRGQDEYISLSWGNARLFWFCHLWANTHGPPQFLLTKTARHQSNQHSFLKEIGMYWVTVSIPLFPIQVSDGLNTRQGTNPSMWSLLRTSTKLLLSSKPSVLSASSQILCVVPGPWRRSFLILLQLTLLEPFPPGSFPSCFNSKLFLQFEPVYPMEMENRWLTG